MQKVAADCCSFSEFSLRKASWGKGIRDLSEEEPSKISHDPGSQNRLFTEIIQGVSKIPPGDSHVQKNLREWRVNGPGKDTKIAR